MEIYLCGGAVRDQLLGRPHKDRDYVVTGTTPEEMLDQGFTKVGADFPVFLNKDGEEYALARQERKTGPGYHGFETHVGLDVTIEEDLLRRDLTINAMAVDGHGKLIDPYGGQKDLENGILRHVSEAFAEDPVRVLRVARFAARYNFEVHPDTLELMTDLVNAGELDHLTKERVWNEFQRAICEEYPNQFFWVLERCGAMDVLFPELTRTVIHMGHALRFAALIEADVEERMMIIFSVIDYQDADTLLNRWSAPKNIQTMALKYNLFLVKLETTYHSAQNTLDLLNNIGAFKMPDHLFKMSRLAMYTKMNVSLNKFLEAYQIVSKITFASLSMEQQTTLIGAAIGAAIRELQLNAIQRIIGMEA